MSNLYNSNGDIIANGNQFDVSQYDLIHTFTPFATDYVTASSTPKVLDINADAFLNTFYNPYLGNNENGIFVGKKELGLDETEQYTIWEYEFRPSNGDYKKTILLSSGMHTYEFPSSFGLARWVKEFMESEEPIFKYLRNNVRIFIIPIVNPWGYNQNPKTYGNSNGINPNRNFDTWNNDWDSYTGYNDEWNKKGEAPFSEKETQILREWAFSHNDANFYIDCHTGLGCTRASYGDVWCYYLATNPKAKKIENAINELVTYISNKYGVVGKSFTTNPNTDPKLNELFWTEVVGIPMMTIEQCHGNDTVYQTVPNNSSVAITEYATQIHAYLMAQLM